MQTVYDGPYIEILHNKLFVPHPEYKSIQKMPQVFTVYQRSIDEIKRNADKGIYKNINELGIKGVGMASSQSSDSREAFVKSLGIEGAFQTEASESARQSPMVDIIEAYAKMIIKDTPYTVGSGIQIKGREEDVIVHIGNYHTILSIQKNTYGKKPFFDMGAYYHPELYWDLGMVELTKGIQEQVNNLANLRIQNVMMQVNQMIKVNVNSDIDPEALVWKPFGIVPVDDMQDVVGLSRDTLLLVYHPTPSGFCSIGIGLSKGCPSTSQPFEQAVASLPVCLTPAPLKCTLQQSQSRNECHPRICSRTDAGRSFLFDTQTLKVSGTCLKSSCISVRVVSPNDPLT